MDSGVSSFLGDSTNLHTPSPQNLQMVKGTDLMCHCFMAYRINPKLAKLSVRRQKQQNENWYGHQALLRVLKNSLPFLPPEVRAEFLKYELYKKEVSQAQMLDLESTNPSIAAEPGENRPPFPPPA